MNANKKETGKRKFRASMKEIRWLQQLNGQSRFEAHDKRVKENELEWKAYTGEGRKSAVGLRDSAKNLVKGSFTSSLNNNSHALQV